MLRANPETTSLAERMYSSLLFQSLTSSDDFTPSRNAAAIRSSRSEVASATVPTLGRLVVVDGESGRISPAIRGYPERVEHTRHW